MLPAERRQVGKQVIGDVFRLTEGGHGTFEVSCVPQDDRGDDEIEPGSTVLLVLVGSRISPSRWMNSSMDQFRLVKSFTRLEGLPPHTWHIQQRLYGAQDLLSRGATVAAGAYAMGFADQAHFTRAFRRLKGVTPGHYRRNHLNLVYGAAS